MIEERKKFKLFIDGEYDNEFDSRDEAVEAMGEWRAWEDRKNLNFGDDVEYVSGVVFIYEVVAQKKVLMNVIGRE